MGSEGGFIGTLELIQEYFPHHTGDENFHIRDIVISKREIYYILDISNSIHVLCTLHIMKTLTLSIYIYIHDTI